MGHAAPLEELHGVFGAEGLLFNGNCRGGQFPHPCLHPIQQGLVQGEAAPGQDEEGAAQRVFHADVFHLLTAHDIIERLQHQQEGAALVGLETGLVLGGNHFQGTVPVQSLVELAELAVPVDQKDVIERAVLKVRGNGAVRGSAGIGVRCAVHSNSQNFFLVHGMASFMCDYPAYIVLCSRLADHFKWSSSLCSSSGRFRSRRGFRMSKCWRALS